MRQGREGGSTGSTSPSLWVWLVEVAALTVCLSVCLFACGTLQARSILLRCHVSLLFKHASSRCTMGVNGKSPERCEGVLLCCCVPLWSLTTSMLSLDAGVRGPSQLLSTGARCGSFAAVALRG